MNTPEQLPEASSLKDAGRKIREIITYLRSLRLTAGQGIRLDHYAAGTTISLSHTPAPAGKSANEYTGGFRLVDMSETVKEKDEEGNEVEKVIPKLGVLGRNINESDRMGTLYYSVGAQLGSSPGVVFDCSDFPINVELNVFAYWSGTSFGVITTKTSGTSDLTKLGSPTCVHIGSYTISATGELTINQIYCGSEVYFSYKHPFHAEIANIGETYGNLKGYAATLRTYPTPDSLSSDSTSGTVFLSESSVFGMGYSISEPAYLTVHPIVVQVVEGN